MVEISQVETKLKYKKLKLFDIRSRQNDFNIDVDEIVDSMFLEIINAVKTVREPPKQS